MKIFLKYLIVQLFLISFTFVAIAQNTNKVIVEMFTNSHCSSCGAAYNNLGNNVFNKDFFKDVVFIAYHINTYSDDKLYQESKAESIPRATWYTGITGTPTFFINGKKYTQGDLSQNIQNAITENKTIDIGLSCSIENGSLIINSDLTANIEFANLKYFIVVTENVNYKGRNGLENHKNVMRTMPNTSAGESISLQAGLKKAINKNVTLNSAWNFDSLSVVVFIQNSVTKEIYNSAILKSADFVPTSIQEKETIENFTLSPLPNKGELNLKFNSLVAGNAKFLVFDLLGRLIEEKSLTTNNGSNSFFIDLTKQNLNKGVYTYSLELDGNKQNGSFVID